MKNPKIVFLLLGFLLFSNQVAAAKDEWIQVESKNFHLIGNASEKDIRKAATKLEQFRETFRLLFNKANFNSAIPTNVVVFKSGSSYKPFKPKRADGKIDDGIAGYFQPGQDVNYITLSTEGEDAETYGTIFHEYVHFMLDINFGKSDIPPWFNEGLAEYYQTFEIEKDQVVKLGIFQQGHINYLSQSQLIPLQTLFNISNYALHQQGNHSRSIFYAQSWALIHYLLQNSNATKRDGLGKFLVALTENVPPEKAFQDVFQMTYAQMEKELKSYISKSSYQYQTVTFKNKLTFDTQMKVSPLSEADTNAYLGDLLFHNNRPEEAEPYLQKTLAIEPNSSLANTTLGMVKFRQRKYEEAKPFLEKAIQGDPKNHMPFYNYAFLLSREGGDEFGYVSSFKGDNAVKMREALQKAIAINPSFIPSYELLGFINLVNQDQLSETVELLKKALTIQPGNQKVLLRIAEIYSRLDKWDEALGLAQKLSQVTDEDEIKARADNLVNWIKSTRDLKAQNEVSRKQYEEAMKEAAKNGGRVELTRRQASNERQLTPEEIVKIREKEMLVSINQALKKPGENEKQIIGQIGKITCVGKNITYNVKTTTGMVSLSSKGFQNLALVALADGAETVQIGCNADLSAFNSVLTYQVANPPKPNYLGELIAIDFVPKEFRFVDLSEEAIIPPVTQTDSEKTNTGVMLENGSPNNEKSEVTGENENPDEIRRKLMLEALKQQIRQPRDGEKREMGMIEKIECDNQGAFFILKTETRVLKLKAPPNLSIRAFTPEAGGVQFGCGLKQFDVPAIFIYKEASNPKAKINGDLISVDFVPKSFKLDN
jgi:tetratricopeptide (TPR) repeat protein